MRKTKKATTASLKRKPALIRARQRSVTAINPHNANRRFIIPNRPSVPPVVV